MSSVNSGPPNIRERLDELLSSSGPGTDARLQENLSLLRSVLSGNSGVIFPSDVARAAVASLEKLAIESAIEFDVGLDELLQYIRSQADRGARIVAAQAVFKLIRAKLNSAKLADDATDKSRCEAVIAEVISAVSLDSLLCRPLNQAIDALKKCVESPKIAVHVTSAEQTVDTNATASIPDATPGPAPELQPCPSPNSISVPKETVTDVAVSAPLVVSSKSIEPLPVFDKGGHWGRRDIVVDSACLEATSLESWRVVARRMRKFYNPTKTSPKAIEMHLGVTNQQLRVLMSYCSVFCAPLHFMMESVYNKLHRSIENITETIAKMKEYEAYLNRTGGANATTSAGSREMSNAGSSKSNSETSNVNTSLDAESGSSKRPRIEYDPSASRPSEGRTCDENVDSATEQQSPRYRFVTRYRIAQHTELPTSGDSAELIDELYSGYKDCDIEDIDEETLQMLHEHGVVIADEVAEAYENSGCEEETHQNNVLRPQSHQDYTYEADKATPKAERVAVSRTSTPVKDSVPKSESYQITKRNTISNAPGSGAPISRQGNYRQGDSRPYCDSGAGSRPNTSWGRSNSHDGPYSSDSRPRNFRGDDRFDDFRDFGGYSRGRSWDEYDESRDFDRERDHFDRDRDHRGGGGWNSRPPYHDTGRHYDGPEGSRGGGWDRESTGYGGGDKRGSSGIYSYADSGPARQGGGYDTSYDGRPNRGGGDSWDNRNYGTYQGDRRGPVHDGYRNDRREMGSAPSRQVGGGGSYSVRR